MGKDTAAEYLMERGWVRLSFADPLKRVVSEMFKVDLDLFNDGEKKNVIIDYWNKTPRDLLIMCGCKMVRDFKDVDFNGESHWIKLLNGELLKLMKNNSKCIKVVITDLRFPNEFEYFKKIGAVIVKVSRDVKLYGGPDSELENFIFDYEIKNNGTKKMLWEQVLSISSKCKDVEILPMFIN